MEWDVTEVPLSMDAFDDILSDFNDLTAVTGTYSITPIADQFGSFDILSRLLTVTDKLIVRPLLTPLRISTTQ